MEREQIHFKSRWLDEDDFQELCGISGVGLELSIGIDEKVIKQEVDAVLKLWHMREEQQENIQYP